MKGSKRIQEEILALKAKRAEAEKKIEHELLMLNVHRTEVDKELEQCEKELEMSEEPDVEMGDEVVYVGAREKSLSNEVDG